jgi:hypothetical protein
VIRRTDSGGNKANVGDNKGMEVVKKRNDGPEAKINTDPFLYKIDIVTIGVET